MVKNIHTHEVFNSLLATLLDHTPHKFANIVTDSSSDAYRWSIAFYTPVLRYIKCIYCNKIHIHQYKDCTP